MEANTVRKVVEVTDTPLNQVTGRNVIRRVEKIMNWVMAAARPLVLTTVFCVTT